MKEINEAIEKAFEIPTVSFLWFVFTLYYVFLTDKDKEFLKRLNWVVFGYLLSIFTKRQRFTILFKNDYYVVGDILTTGKTEVIKLFNNKYIFYRRRTKYGKY